MSMLTQSQIKELFEYRPETGEFIRLSSRGNSSAGALAGHSRKNGYRTIWIDGKHNYAHRLAWLYVYGYLPENQIDHVNHDPSDNRLINLRQATNTENSRNFSLGSRNRSGQCGVSWHAQRSKWRATIRAGGKNIHLGLFATQEAALVARKAAEAMHGYHPNHGAAK